MFEIRDAVKAKLIDTIVLSSKNRQPDENPGAKLVVEMTLPNTYLIMLDGALRTTLFRRDANVPTQQEALDGIEAVSDLPNLTSLGARLGTFKWSQELTGYELVIDLGLGKKGSNIDITSCTLSGWRITAKEGGTIVAKVNIESPDVSEKDFGKLAKLKSREIHISLVPPEVEGQQPLSAGGDDDADDETETDATDAFLNQHAPAAG